MESSKKILLSTIGIAVLIVVLTGVTFAFFNYTRTGSQNVIKTGRIYFNSEQGNAINLTNMFPIDTSVTGIMDDATKVGTVIIHVTGDTTYSEGIEYLVSAVNVQNTTGSTALPISINVSVQNNNESSLGTSDTDYFNNRGTSAGTSIYKVLAGETIRESGRILVGYIKSGQDGVDGNIVIKAYFDKERVAITDTYDGTESDTNGTTNDWVDGRVTLTTEEWNSLKNNGVSFKIKVEANEGIWVSDGSLYSIMKEKSVMDNISSTYVSANTGINFKQNASDTNGKGVYMRAGTENDTYPVVYYRGAVENNNVRFADKCWKAVRSTDTGGVKLIYNGEQSPRYSSEYTDPDTYASENEKDIFTFDSMDNTWNYEVNDGHSHEISFKVPTGDNYRMVITGTTGPTCIAQIMLYKDDNTNAGTYGGNGSAINYSYSYGSLTSSNIIKMVISDSGSTSSTCSVNIKMNMQQDTTKLSKSDYSVLMEKDTGKLWCNNNEYDTVMNILETKTFPFNINTNSPAYVGYMYGTVYEANNSNWTNGARFGSGFTWDGTNYKLVDATVTNPDAPHHYSCNSTDEEATCTSIRYVYWRDVQSSTKPYYITISDGKGIEEALEDMQENINSSNAKQKIDSWFASNMVGVADKLEDTVWCNDRSVWKYNGWSSTGSITDLSADGFELLYGTAQIYYGNNTITENSQPILVCSNKNDAFTVNNESGNQKLTYPVALLTADEVKLSGGTLNNSFLYNGLSYNWSMSPAFFHVNYAAVYSPVSYTNVSNQQAGLRPSVSLKPGTPVVSGTGTETDPYVIE